MLSQIIENDYQYGRGKEGEVLTIMENYFKDNIKQTAQRYDTKDYLGEKYKYELKSRRNKYNAFPTTLMPMDKTGDNVILLFNFTDGLYYIQYDKEIFSKFKTGLFQRKDGGQNNPNKVYYYIPIEKLQKI